MKFKRICAFPNCQKTAEYPAPRSPDKIKERIYFCLDHVREYNKKWNGLEGFSGDEIFNMQVGSYWNRPTWAMGLGSKSYKTATAHGRLNDPFDMFEARTEPEPARQKKTAPKPDLGKLPGQIRTACETLGTDNPLDEGSIKVAYRKLAKQYHPDVNRDNQEAMDRIQRVNEAYKTLMRYAKKNA